MAMLDMPNNSKNPPASGWTDEKVARLRKMHAAGKRYPVIGDELGFTRNAIAGKVLRLGLDKRKAPKRSDGGALARRLSNKGAANSDRAATQRIAHKLKVRQPSRGGVAMVDTVIRDEGPVPADFLCIALIDLEPQHCRFPRGGEDGEPVTFCGQRKLDGESYCRAHHRIAYQPPRARVERAYLPTGGSKLRVF